MKRFLALMLIMVMALSLFPLSMPTAQANNSLLPAFPGAEGFGNAAAGGRGGEVYHVTSYELTGPGTFHDALMTAGSTPRTIVFDISGEITIPQIVVTNKSHITIAGQTAPGDGVTIRGNNIRFIDSNDIVIRYLRFRMGKLNVNDDTMYFEDCQNVIIDHSTFSWGTDEVLSIKSKDYENPRSKNITVQWSIISEGLLTHSMGGLIEMNTITMHHNLYAHNNDRNPKTKGQIDFVNNIVYNWGGFPYVAGGESGTKGYGNVVGNYFIAGRNSADPEYAVVRGNENYQVYLQNNRIDSNKNGQLDGADTGTGIIEAEKPSVVMPERFEYPLVNTQAPEEAYASILDHAGSSLVRDAVDTRVTNSVRNQTGVIIGDEQDMGGFPPIKRDTAPADQDRDGMPDAWELANGLNPGDAEDRNGDLNGDGYTNLEAYLNELAAPGFPAHYPMKPPVWSGPPFTPPVVEPEPEPEPEPAPSIDGAMLRNVVINDNSSSGSANEANWSVQSNLQLGDVVFGDRMTGSKIYKFLSMPEHLKGQEWVRTAVASRSATNDDLVSFYLSADADVYVAYDARITTEPEWLTSAYELTGETIADSQPVEYKLYKKRFTAGEHVVMGSNNNTSKCPYFIILKPVNPGAEPPAAAPSDLAGVLTSTSAVQLNWLPVNGADAYLIYRSSSKEPVWKAMASTESAAYTDTAVEQGVTYRYQVSALNAGGESPLSRAVEIFTFDASQPAPAAPSNLSVTAARSLSVELEWAPVAGALSYSLYRASEPDGNYSKIGTVAGAVYADRTVSPSTSYTYKVTATGIGGESAASGIVTATTKAPLIMPETPAGLASGQVSASSFAIQWQASAGAESYNIYRKADGKETYALIGNSASSAYVDDSVNISSTGYLYKVSAVNERGESAQTSELRIAMPVPATPSDLTVGLVGDTFVGLIWTSHGGETQVNVYREANGVVENLGYTKVHTYYDRTAVPGVQYVYYIKAANAAGESEASNRITVTPGLMTVLETYTDQFLRTGGLTGPLASQLSNTLKQVKHHLDKNMDQQAIKFLEKYLELLGKNKTQQQEHISSEAEFTLSYYAELFLKQLKKQA
ncbi:FIMAH domain-containing protein [Paenibacillus sp. GCM10023248]|uniref:FIMAH domain-containing protein n=1 Tax=unclassified Paenibacillus TaxID=185978 RepID=UPI0023783901|nr:pectinesterase [Paenibacillus sp. MAHUQ-63]MDD9266214.1 pectinesterase [Paenibacillus sp. MAHUQ-63]